ncbi:DUF2321 domain-containing protein [Heliobacterium chlorum]|uniref:DUF2321 domain-containing protein n=1 Tax=Heliobacterium chlorum TaxID=2698 RepID=A0ABR7T202_HELCL|nr:DUF2321 domain-containing protein [Heliobacterium chlorum]MBC9783561.1 DUF2321 domain-containing protein [Heliobacterium chlorum]
MRQDRDPWYDTALVCLNGHLINASSKEYPMDNQKYCGKCGEPTIDKCQKCNTDIRGYYNIPGFADLGTNEIRSFCHECGEPYPWTKSRIEAAKELAEEINGLSKEERDILSRSIDDIVKDSPKTTVATTRLKKFMAKAGPVVAQGFKDILVDIVSETVKKTLWP